MPSRELCEAARKALITLPAVDHGAVVANDCKERQSVATSDAGSGDRAPLQVVPTARQVGAP
jgi:hypothetical protein